MTEVLKKYNKLVKKYKDNYVYYNELPLCLQNEREIIKYELTKKLSGNVILIKKIPSQFTDDEEIMSYAVRASDMFLKQASNRLKSDEKFIIKNRKSIKLNYNEVSLDLRKREDFILRRIKDGYYLDIKYLSNIKKILSIIKKDGEIYYSLSEKMKNKKEIYLTFFKYYNLSYISTKKDFKKDKDVIALIKKRLRVNEKTIDKIEQELPNANQRLLDNPILFCLLNEKYTNNRELMLELVKKHEVFYNFIKNEFQEEYEFLKHALKVVPTISKKFSKDKNVIKEHIKNMSFVDLSYVDKSVWSDKDILKTCIENNVSCLNYVDSSIKKDEELLNWIIDNKDGEYLWYYVEKMDKGLINKEGFVDKILSKSPICYNLLNAKNRNNKEVFFKINFEKIEAGEFLSLSRTLLKDKDVINSVIEKKIYGNFYKLPAHIRNCHEIVANYLSFDKTVYIYVNKEEKNNENNIAMIKGSYYNLLPNKYKKNIDIIKSGFAVGLNIKKVEKSMRNNKELVLAYLLRDYINFKFISKSFMKNKEDFKWVLENIKEKNGIIKLRLNNKFQTVWDMISPNWTKKFIKNLIKLNPEYREAFYSLYDQSYFSMKNKDDDILDNLHAKVCEKDLQRVISFNKKISNKIIKF